MFNDEVSALEHVIDQWKNGYITNEDLRRYISIWHFRTAKANLEEIDLITPAQILSMEEFKKRWCK
jgi:hypothetical protein